VIAAQATDQHHELQRHHFEKFCLLQSHMKQQWEPKKVLEKNVNIYANICKGEFQSKKSFENE
jgi:hypothetical protein